MGVKKHYFSSMLFQPSILYNDHFGVSALHYYNFFQVEVLTPSSRHIKQGSARRAADGQALGAL
jgi:hypothetical protein